MSDARSTPNDPGSATPGAAGSVVMVPYLCLADAAKAIEFYGQAFGATEVMRLVGNDGKVGHAELRIGDAALYLSDEFPDYGNQSAETLGGSPVMIALEVPDVDAFTARAVGAGAEVVRPVQDQFYGERSGQIRDPFGYRWGISTKTEDLSPEEMQRRATEAMR